MQLFAALYGIDGAAAKRAIDDALELVGSADRAHDRVRDYSGGMKRRLNLASALLHDPQILLLDEPTVGVDPQSRNAIFDNLEVLKSRGKTLLYTTHYMEEAERLCDRVVIMDHGKVVAERHAAGPLSSIARDESAAVELDHGHERPPRWPKCGRFPACIRPNMAPGHCASACRIWPAETPRVLEWLVEHGQRYHHVSSERADLETRIPDADRKELARLMMIPFRALVRKDILLFFVDRRALLMSFAIPIAIGSFFGYVLGGAGDQAERQQDCGAGRGPGHAARFPGKSSSATGGRKGAGL